MKIDLGPPPPAPLSVSPGTNLPKYTYTSTYFIYLNTVANPDKKLDLKQTNLYQSSYVNVSSEKECPVGDITIHGKMQKNALVDVSRMIKEIITATEELYCKILQYEPIDILLIKVNSIFEGLKLSVNKSDSLF